MSKHVSIYANQFAHDLAIQACEHEDRAVAAQKGCSHCVAILSIEDGIPAEFVEEFLGIAAELGGVVRREVRS